MFTSPAWAAQSTLLACRCHILVADYRWGSIGSKRPLRRLLGASIMDVLTGTGAIGSKLHTFFGATGP